MSRRASGTAVAIIVAKIMASLALLLATLGILWHKTYLPNWLDPAENLLPAWIVHLASGWYPEMIWTASHLFLKSIASALVYFGACMLCVGCFFLIPFISNGVVRILISLLFVVGILYDLTMYQIGGFLPSLPTTSNLIANLRFGLEGGTVGLYRGPILVNLMFAAVIGVIFVSRPPKLEGVLRAVPILWVSGTAIAIVAIVWRTSGYTSSFPPPVTSLINVYKTIATEDQKIADVEYSGGLRSAFDKIVFIMDESVRGDYLGLNNAPIGNTPFLSGDNRIINFGLATSFANCSTPTRLAIRFGVRDKDAERPWQVLRGQPTIWQYAKRAGFRVVYIDTFGTAVTPSSGMTSSEQVFLDSRIVVRDLPRYKRDEVVAAKVREALDSPGRMFLFVDKHGTHVPYNDLYPPNENIYGADATEPFTVTNRPELIKHYKNAIRWSVDHFFEAILGKGLPPKTLIVYTSDHGQSLSETPSGVSHCSEAQTAVKSEAIVPLFAVTNVADWEKRLVKGAAVNLNRASHFEVVPTLLTAMGYDKHWVDDNFDKGLVDPIPLNRKRRFMAGEKSVKFDE